MFGIEAYANENAVYLFFCIFIIIGIYLWSYHWKASKMEAFAHIDSMKKIADSVSLPKKLTKRTLVCIAYLLLVFSLMRPQGNPDQELNNETHEEKKKTISSALSLEDIKNKKGKGTKIKVRESARDIIFLLDVSASMGAEDLYPNRLQKAKDMILDIVSALDGEHIGLVIFTSVPSVKCILTLDYSYFKKVLEGVEINDNDFAGTKFTPSLEEITGRQFDFSENKYKDLIIITDGGDTDLEALDDTDKAAFEKEIYDHAKMAFDEKGIKIHSIGLGTKAGSIVHGVKDSQGNPVRSSLNEEFLKNISRNAKGIYVSVEDSYVDMKEIYKNNIAVEGPTDKEIEKEIDIDPDKLKELVQKQKEKEEKKVVYEEFYIYPLILAVFLLFAEFFISEKKRIRPEKEMKK
jgi:Ca-activated chloride channel homolog